VDPKISVIPISVINFVTRTVIGTIWGQLLHVAKQVQNGERIHHIQSIQSQPELYQFIEHRVQSMLQLASHKVHRNKTDEDEDDKMDETNLQYISYLQN
jgi:hypothetical protein